jgi:hypothetical protein
MAGKKGKGKQPPVPSGAPSVKQSPRTLPELPGSSNSEDRLCWRFAHVDDDGPWGLGRLATDALSALLKQLVSFESMTVNEAFHRSDYPGKCYDLEAIPNDEALERLEACGLADQTKIWRLRIGGTGRLYGFLAGNVFHVVFWDPEHEIWPSQLRNT